MLAVRRLENVCEISMGQAPDGNAYNDSGDGWPLIAGAGDFGEVHPAPKKYTTEAPRVSRAGDIILGIRATIGEKVLSDGEYCLGRGVAGLRAKPDLNPRYLWQWLTYVRPTLAAKGKGATFKQVNKLDIGELEIALPSLSEQHRIATILDQVDALCGKRSQTLSLLDELQSGIFNEMFGDPVTCPKGCVPATLGDCVEEMQYGPRFYNEAYSDDGIRIVRITDLNGAGNLDFDAMPRMAVDEETLARFALRAGDVVFARTGATVGKVALIREDDPQCIAGAYFIRMKFHKRIIPEYAYSVLRSRSVQSLIVAQSRQAAQQNFSGPGLRRLPMPVPPVERQQQFARRLEAVRCEKSKSLASLTLVNELFSSLQHRAFRGEL